MIQHRSIQEMNSAITPSPALSLTQMTPEKKYCPKHPIGAQSESALFSFLQVYPLLVSVVGQLEQAELLNLILTCKTVSALVACNKAALKNMQKQAIQTSTEKCKFCHGLLLCCVRCRLEFHVSTIWVQLLSELIVIRISARVRKPHRASSRNSQKNNPHLSEMQPKTPKNHY